ncbi:SRPBCC family protein [Paracoccus tegillarcae]|uniref:Polyketide cyclase n=1 Tax=Paracoccus tegillarcae TaxID=1529068 RepID=A0A2K9F2L0_9RHOB|nr:SRPBCC family protein [Paracoccus tegillarcae]AUH34602.1 polyketide cyclase [Paracoccus tegillarcae]
MSQNTVIVEDLDLTISRHINAAPEKLWRAWTEPELLKQWFAPKPVEVTKAEMDPRPGGICNIVMRLPDGTEMDSPGCVLVAEPGRKLVFTDSLGPDFRPADGGFMTAIILLEPEGDGCLYSARVLHKSPADRQKHEEMGFADGWGTCLDQLADLVES